MTEQRETHKRVRLWSGDFVLSLLIALFAFVACQSLNNGTPLYIVRIGGSTGFSGTLILVFSAAAAVARLFAGRIIDRFGRRRIMIAGSLLMIAGTVLAIPFSGMMPQIVLRAFQGLGFACVTTASATMAADVLPAQRLGEGIGYYALGQSLGMAIGPALGIFLCSLVFTESLFVGAAAVCAVLFLLVLNVTYEKHIERLPETSEYRLMEERRQMEAESIVEQEHESLGDEAPQDERAASLEDSDDMAEAMEEVTESEEDAYHGLARFFEKRAFVGAIPMLVICFAFAIPTSYTALYAQSIGFEGAGWFFFVGAIAMTATRFFGGRLLDVVPPRLLFALTGICGIVMFMMVAFATSEIMLYAAGFFFGVSMGFAFPLLNSMAIKNTPAQRWGAANAMFFLANDLGVGIGACGWGFVVDTWGFFPIMMGGASMFVVAYVIALLIFPKRS